MKKFNSLPMTEFVIKNKALFVFLIIFAISIPLTQGLILTPFNISSVARQLVATTILALGTTIIIACGGVDLSAGQAMNMVGIVYGLLSINFPLPVALFGAVIVGVAAGLLNSSITYKFDLPPFILTLAMAQVYKGIAYLLVDGASVSGLSAQVKYIGQGMIFGVVPVSVIIMVICIVFVYLLMMKTKFGRHAIATGGNENAAKVSGVKTKKIKIYAYMIAGVLVAISAIILTGRMGSALPNAADGMEMDAIAAVVIGGTAMSGGKINVTGTFFGCLIIVIIGNVLNLLGVSSFYQYIAKGVIIVLAIIIDSTAEAYLNKRVKGAN
ncbi:MAG: ABC transporter permease [Erysipelotrichaceae bacterium]